MNRETSIGGSDIRFPRTLWTSVLQAKAGEARREALDGLIRAYWKPVYFFVRRKGHAVEEAKDLTQEFFAVFLEKDFLRCVFRERGRFRTFVLAALNHFLSKEYRSRTAQKRGGGRLIVSLHFAEVEERMPAGTPDEAFDREWAYALLEQALARLRAESDPREFDALSPYLTRGTRHYDEVARNLGWDTKAVARKVFGLRTRLRSFLENRVRETVETARDCAAELERFAGILRNPE